MSRICHAIADVLILRVLWMRDWLRAVRAERRRWQPIVSHEAIRVFYGRDHIPRRDEPASGGIVKCQDLESLFPNAPQGATMMYWVSSALPPAPGVVWRYARKAQAQMVWNQNGVAIPAYHDKAGCRAINAPRRSLFLDADYVVYQSAFCEKTARRFLGERQGPSEVLYNPVDTTVFTPKSHAGISDEPVLLLAGSHCHQYRVFSAIRGLAEMKRRGMAVRLVIAGRLVWENASEDCSQQLLALSKELDVSDHVTLRGEYRQVEAVDMMRSGDILLHTKYMDPCPRLVVEAMACGLPVVYSGSGGVPELVGDEAGVAVAAPEDWDRIHEISPSEMADAVAQVLAAYPAYSHAARTRAETRFDVKPWLSRHKEIFEALHAG
jgi:glycosyltransferase involved in cell wall biosynthesis